MFEIKKVFYPAFYEFEKIPIIMMIITLVLIIIITVIITRKVLKEC